MLIAVIAGGLLYAGGLKAMQTASIIAGFPISIFLFIMCITLYKSLNKEADRINTLNSNVKTVDQDLSKLS